MITATDTTWTTTVPSPVGDLVLTSDGTSLTRLLFTRPAASVSAHWRPDTGPFAAIRTELDAYFAGVRTRFEVPLRAAGTPFQQRVWAALAEIPYRQTRSYAQLAAAVGQPTAVRAVGLANGRNPLSIVVPCHRVIGADGSLTGYGGGLANKQFLLELEGARPRNPQVEQPTLL